MILVGNKKKRRVTEARQDCIALEGSTGDWSSTLFDPYVYFI
jgi:hypothetical protein